MINLSLRKRNQRGQSRLIHEESGNFRFRPDLLVQQPGKPDCSLPMKSKTPRISSGRFRLPGFTVIGSPVCAWIAFRGCPSAVGDTGGWLVIGLCGRSPTAFVQPQWVLGFNRWMQRIGEIVQRVLRSPVFS